MALRWLAVLLIFTVGCGQAKTLKTVPVSGKITYKGAAVEGALVTFATPTTPRTASGVTDKSGEFKLTTINSNDGAMVGEHIITISKMPAPGSVKQQMTTEEYMKAMQGSKSAKPPGSDDAKGTLPVKYADPVKSNLKRTVVENETNRFEIDLTD